VADGNERIGAVLNGTYRLERMLGEGGMGTVYEAAHQRVPRRFAVKMLNPEILGNREVFDRFRREAEIASSLGSQHIVQVFDFNHAEDGTPYMVLELLEGHDLAKRIATRGRLTLDQTNELLEQASQALSKAHAAGIVHRDLKPANIYLANVEKNDSFVKVLDFGISKVLHTQTGATRTGAVFGTPNYMSPEQAEGRQTEIDHRTDIFAVGAILYECLTGKVAFEAPTLVGTIYQVCHGTPQPIRSFAPEIPTHVEQVLARAMAKQRDQRYPDIDALREDFRKASTVDAMQATMGFATVAAPPPTAALAHAAAEQAGVAQTTLGAASSEVISRPPTAPPQQSRAKVVAIAGAAGIALGLVLWLALGRKPAPEPAPALTPATVTAPEAVPPTPTPAAPAPEQAAKPTPKPATAPEAIVQIRLRLTPADARVELDGVMTEANPLRLPRGDRTHKLVVSAPGHVSAEREIRALLDGEVVVELERKVTRRPARKRPAAKPTPKKPQVELEDW